MLYGMVQVRDGENTLAAHFLRQILIDAEKLPQSRTLDWIKARTYDWLGLP